MNTGRWNGVFSGIRLQMPGELTLADAVETVAAAAPQMRLRLGQRVGTLLLQGVLRGQHQERPRPRCYHRNGYENRDGKNRPCSDAVGG